MTNQSWDPQTYMTHAKFVSDYGVDVLEVLLPKSGERILDLGCGEGALTERIVAAGCSVVGIDTSVPQLAAARKRGLDVRLVDATEMTFDAEFDAVFSNATLHWILDADAVLDKVYRALKPGGRFVAEFGGAGNVATIYAALQEGLARRGIEAHSLNPWMFPALYEYQQRLEKHRFIVKNIVLFSRPTPLPSDIANWLQVFAQPFLSAVPSEDRGILIAEVASMTRPKLFDAVHGWHADYVRLRFEAHRGTP